MADQTPRLALPLLAAGQAQKEITHNMALAVLDALVQPVAEDFATTTPPTSPAAGQSWILGASPTGTWSGQAHAIATWSDGGWRYVSAVEGLWLWVRASGLWASFTGGTWRLGAMPAAAIEIGGNQIVGAQQPAIAAPAGGTTVDAQCRTALAEVIVALKTHGLIAA